MKKILPIILLLFAGICSSPAQTSNVKWEPLIINNEKRIWYEVLPEDTDNKNTLTVWILQMHNPPLEFKEIPEKVYRTKTEYCINTVIGKYGIKKAVYYGVKNNLLYNFDYHLDTYPDSLKYTYPVKDNFFINLLLQKIGSKEPN